MPWRRPLQAPDGSINQADRQQLARLYFGIAAGAAFPVVVEFRIDMDVQTERRLNMDLQTERRLNMDL
jgi:hypothetical protein